MVTPLRKAMQLCPLSQKILSERQLHQEMCCQLGNTNMFDGSKATHTSSWQQGRQIVKSYMSFKILFRTKAKRRQKSQVASETAVCFCRITGQHKPKTIQAMRLGARFDGCLLVSSKVRASNTPKLQSPWLILKGYWFAKMQVTEWWLVLVQCLGVRQQFLAD